MTHQYIVITGVPLPSEGETGNLATALGNLFRADGTPVDPMTQLALSIPVFTTGEIIVCNLDGREIGGVERKPSKWFVDYETFHTVEAAIECSLGVTARQSA